jgi:hypothetical protein
VLFLEKLIFDIGYELSPSQALFESLPGYGTCNRMVNLYIQRIRY